MASPLTLRRIFAPVDFGAPTEAALGWVALLGEAFDADIELFRTFRLPIHPIGETGWVPTPDERAAVEASSRQLLAACEAQILRRYASARVAKRFCFGDPVEDVLERISEARPDLAVMGTHGRGFWSRAVLGSVTRRIVPASACPLFTVHADCAAPRRLDQVKTILAPIDLDPDSQRGLELAIQLAKHIGCQVRVLFAGIAPDEGAPFPEPHAVELVVQGVNRAAARILESRRSDGVVLQPVVSRASPLRAIVEQSRRPDVGMIVMATHPKGMLHRLISGSVANDVVRLSECPVVTLAQP